MQEIYFCLVFSLQNQYEVQFCCFKLLPSRFFKMFNIKIAQIKVTYYNFLRRCTVVPYLKITEETS